MNKKRKFVLVAFCPICDQPVIGWELTEKVVREGVSLDQLPETDKTCSKCEQKKSACRHDIN